MNVAPKVERTHAKYAASAAYRWMLCAGSVKLIGRAPKREPSPWAQDGTEAHALLEFSLRGKYRDAWLANVEFDLVPTYRADDEMERLASVQTALDYVYGILDAYEDAELILEHQAVFPSHVTDECGGTNDIIIIVHSLGLMYVIDFKHGAGVAVEVQNNKQMLIYGVMAFDGIDGEPTVVLVIIQPRAMHRDGPIREWLVPAGHLEDFISEVDDAIISTMADDAPLVPGEAQCRWCDAATICPAIEAKALAAINVNFASVRQVTAETLPKAIEQPVDRLAYILQTRDIVEAWYVECYRHALELAKAGYTIPGHKLVTGDSKRQWHGDEAQIANDLMLLSGAELDDVYPRKLIGILAAEKIVADAFKAQAPEGGVRAAAKEAHQVFSEFTTKEPSETISLVPVGDRRQAVTIQSQFGAVALPPPAKT